MSSTATARTGPDAARRPLWVAAAIAALLALGFRPRGNGAATDIAPRDTGSSNTGVAGADWKQTLRRVGEGISKRRIIAIAAGVTFYSLLALFPAIAALVALYGLI